MEDAKEDGQNPAEALTGWFAQYGGFGRHFSEEPFVDKKTKYHVLVKQWVGLDI